MTKPIVSEAMAVEEHWMTGDKMTETPTPSFVARAPVTITEVMVEAGARKIDPEAWLPISPAFEQWAENHQDAAKAKARACLEAALAVREGEDG